MLQTYLAQINHNRYLKIHYLNLNQYKFSKKEVSDIFNISRSTLYRWLDE